MKKLAHPLMLSLSIFLFNSCTAIKGIFNAGMWSGILLVVVIIIAVIWIISKVLGGGK